MAFDSDENEGIFLDVECVQQEIVDQTLTF